MRKWNKAAALGVVLIFAGVATAATFDRGLIAKSTPSSGTSAGQQLSGVVSVVFSDYDSQTGTASGFDSVVQLRKGNVTHVFLYEYACVSGDPCGLCVVGGLIGTGDQVGIQMCIEDGIESEVKQDFALPSSVSVRLKDVTDPAAKIYLETSTLVFGASIEVTAK